MGSENVHNLKDTKAKLDYLKELLTDRNILANDPRTYLHVGKILEKEILRIRSALFATYGINPISENDLPDPEGPKVNLQTKVYMPTDSANSFNFVGRILGPDGSTAKCLQQCLGVKIMVRGRGSMRDRKKEEANIGKPNWEHLNDRLHVVLTVEDHENRAKARLDKASEYITLFLQESMKGSDKDDKVKQMQLMELSFRREPCSSWRFNCGSLLDMSFPQKTGGATIFPNTAPNFLNIGYAYQPPLFSPLHHNPMSSVSHLGAYGQQHPGHHHPHQSQQQAQHQQAMGNQLAAAGYPYSNNLNATATFLLGHSPTSAAGYTSPYSPNSQSTAPAAGGGGGPGMAMAPMSYWAGGQGQLPAEYATFTQANNPTNGQSETEKADQNGTYTRGDLIQQYGLTELDGFRDLKLQDANTVGYPDASNEQSNNGTLENKNEGDMTADPVTVNANTISNGKSSTTRRYSQKHSCQLLHRTPNSPRGTVARSAIVTVRIPSSSAQHSPPMNNVVDGTRSPNSSAFHVPPKKSSTPNGGLSLVGSDNEEDWPKLGAGGEREKDGKKVTAAQATKNPETPESTTLLEEGSNPV